jgi:O-antigen/teichoic acid export membrane protein
MPVSEVGPAMQRAVIPVLASIKHDEERTRLAALKILSSVATVVWPLAFGFSALASDATKLVLGENWLAAVPFVAVFSIIAALQSSGGPLQDYLTLWGHTRVQSIVIWFEFSSFLVTALLIVPIYGLFGLACARGISSLLSVMAFSYSCHKYSGLHWKSNLKYCYRPILIALLMHFVVKITISNFDSLFLRLSTGIAIGVLFYTSLIMISWYLSGKPEGMESTVFDKLRETLNKSANKSGLNRD